MVYVYYALIALIGGFLQGVSGMGFGMFCMAFWTLLLPYVPVLTSVRFLTVIFAFSVIPHWKKLRWKMLLPPCVASVFGNLIAVKLLIALPEQILKISLGVLILAFALFELLNKRTVMIRPCLRNGIGVGLITGLCSGISGVGGPPLAIYYLNTEELAYDKEGYYATIIMSFQLVGFSQIITILMCGMATPEAMHLVSVGLVPVIVGILAGRRLFSFLNVEKIKQMIYLLTLVMGLMLILSNV